MIRSLGIWLIIGLVMLFLFNMMGSQSGNEQRISFTEFMDKVETGSVLEVVAQGNNVIGVTDGNQRFQTQVPDYPGLYQNLRENNVRIRVSPPESGNQGRALQAADGHPSTQGGGLLRGLVARHQRGNTQPHNRCARHRDGPWGIGHTIAFSKSYSLGGFENHTAHERGTSPRCQAQVRAERCGSSGE